MRYFWNRIAQRLRPQLLSQFFFFLLLSLGACFMVVGLNQYYTGQAYLGRLKEERQDIGYRMESFYRDNSYQGNALAITPKDLKAFEQAEGLLLLYHLEFFLTPLFEGKTPDFSLKQLKILVLNDAALEQLDLSLSPKSVLLPSSALPLLRYIDKQRPCHESKEPCYDFITGDKMQIRFNKKRLKLFGQNFSYRIASPEEEGRIVDRSHIREERSYLKDTMVMHLADIEKKSYENKRAVARLYFKITDEDEGLNAVYAMSTALNAKASPYFYHPSNDFLLSQRFVKDSSYAQTRLAILAFFTMLLVALAIAVLHFMKIHERLREAAIAMALGSELQAECLALLLETGGLIFLSFGTGALAASQWGGRLRFQDIDTVFHIESLLWLLALALTMLLLTTYLPLRRLRRMQLVDILQAGHG